MSASNKIIVFGTMSTHKIRYCRNNVELWYESAFSIGECHKLYTNVCGIVVPSGTTMYDRIISDIVKINRHPIRVYYNDIQN